MKSLFLSLFLSILCLANIHVFAQSEINPELLPEGISLEEASELVNLYESAIEESLGNPEEPEPEIQQILEITKNAQQQIGEVLQNDERYLEFQERIEALYEQNLPPEERTFQEQQLEEEYGEYFLNRIGEAGIDLQAIEMELREVLPENARFNRFKGVSYGKKTQYQVAPPKPGDVTEKTFTKFPFTDVKYTELGPVIRDTPIIRADQNGKTETIFNAAIGIGSTHGLSTVGQFVKVPAGISRVEVEFNIDFSAQIEAISVIFGTAWTSAHQNLIVVGPGINKTQKDHIGTAVAYLILSTKILRNKKAHKATFSFQPSSAGGIYKIAMANEGHGFAIGAAGGNIFSQKMDVKNLKVRFIR